MGDGKVFVRECPSCGVRHQTADQTGQTKCDACLETKLEMKPAPAMPEAELPPVFFNASEPEVTNEPALVVDKKKDRNK